MNSHILVCPYNRGRLSGLQGRKLVVQLNSVDQVDGLATVLASSRNSLHCAAVHWSAPLGDLPFRESWRQVPLLVYAKETGRFRDLAKRLPVIRRLNLRV